MVADALDGMKRVRWTVLGPAWRPIVAASTMVVLAVGLLIGFLLLSPAPIASGPQAVRDDVDASADLTTFTTLGVDTPFDTPLRPQRIRTRQPATAPTERDVATGPRGGGATGSGQGSSGSRSGSGTGTSTDGGSNPGPTTVTPPTTPVQPVVTAPQPDPVKPGKGPTKDVGQGPPVGVPPADTPPADVPPVQVGPIADTTVTIDSSSATIEIGTTSVTVGSNGIQVG